MRDSIVIKSVGNRTVVIKPEQNQAISMEILLRGKHLATLVFEKNEAIELRREIVKALTESGVWLGY